MRMRMRMQGIARTLEGEDKQATHVHIMDVPKAQLVWIMEDDLDLEQIAPLPIHVLVRTNTMDLDLYLDLQLDLYLSATRRMHMVRGEQMALTFEIKIILMVHLLPVRVEGILKDQLKGHARTCTMDLLATTKMKTEINGLD